MKKHYKLTPDERTKHEQAVKIRRMTDAQIYQYIDDLCKGNYTRGQCDQATLEMETRHKSIEQFLSRLSCMAGTGTGIGHATVSKLWEFAREEGYVDGKE